MPKFLEHGMSGWRKRGAGQRWHSWFAGEARKETGTEARAPCSKWHRQKSTAELGTTREEPGPCGSGVWFWKTSTSSKMAGLSQAFLPELVTSHLRYLAYLRETVNTFWLSCAGHWTRKPAKDWEQHRHPVTFPVKNRTHKHALLTEEAGKELELKLFKRDKEQGRGEKAGGQKKPLRAEGFVHEQEIQVLSSWRFRFRGGRSSGLCSGWFSPSARHTASVPEHSSPKWPAPLQAKTSSGSRHTAQRRLGQHREGYPCIYGSYAFPIEYICPNKENGVLSSPSLVRAIPTTESRVHLCPGQGRQGLFCTAERPTAKSAAPVKGQPDIAHHHQ